MFDGPTPRPAIAIDVTAPQTGALYFSAVATGGRPTCSPSTRQFRRFGSPRRLRKQWQPCRRDGSSFPRQQPVFLHKNSPDASPTGPALFKLGADNLDASTRRQRPDHRRTDQVGAHFTVFDSLYFIGEAPPASTCSGRSQRSTTALRINLNGDAFGQNLDNGWSVRRQAVFSATDGSHRQPAVCHRPERSAQPIRRRSAGEDSHRLQRRSVIQRHDPNIRTPALPSGCPLQIDANGVPTHVADICGCPIDHLSGMQSDFHLFNGGLYFNELGSTLTGLFKLSQCVVSESERLHFRCQSGLAASQRPCSRPGSGDNRSNRSLAQRGTRFRAPARSATFAGGGLRVRAIVFCL